MKIARFWMLLAGLLSLTLKPSAVANDIITLNSGEVITGTITSENATQLVIEVSNASRTIFHSRSVSKSEIKPVQRETAEAKQERLSYESILSFRPRPDQEFTVAQYDSGIAACQKFLGNYPTSEYAAVVTPLAVQLQQEKEQVEKGLEKFGSRWMSATLKSAEKDLRTSFIILQQAKQALPSLEEKRRQNMGSTRTHDELFSAEQACKVANQNYEAARFRRDSLASSFAQQQTYPERQAAKPPQMQNAEDEKEAEAARLNKLAEEFDGGEKIKPSNMSFSTGKIQGSPIVYPNQQTIIPGRFFERSLDFSDDGTVRSDIRNKGTYQIRGHKIRFAWDDPNLPVYAEIQGDVMFWGNNRYRKQ